MATKDVLITLDEEILDKIAKVAEEQKRTRKLQIEYIVQQACKDYNVGESDT